MKKARNPRSESPSKRVRFSSGRSAAERDVTVPAPMSMTEYAERVRGALRGRAKEYREFVDIVADLRRAMAAADDDDNDSATEKIVCKIERAVSLLDGRPELIAGLRMFLPSQYHIDVQPDAVVIKVYQTQGNRRMVDTGHGRPVDGSFVQLPTSQSRRHRTTTRPSVSDKRLAVTAQGWPPSGGGRPTVDVHPVADTVNYVTDVKRALESQPQVYRQFVHVLQRYHDQCRDAAPDRLRDLLHSVRQIVSLLRTRPQLVLGFNEFLPDGYRIRMFDRSGYVIEYPDAAGGIARLTYYAKKLLNGLSQNLVERWHGPRKNHSMLVVCGGWWDPNDSTWMFISNNIATSAALAEVCVLLSVILVYYCVLYIPKFQRKSA